jgi:phospholipase C
MRISAERAGAVVAAVAIGLAVPLTGGAASGGGHALQSDAAARTTATPIHHLVVIFDENQSFDHYFGTYPVAANPPGEPAFHARPGTPTVNGLTPALLHHNPNLFNPVRLDRNHFHFGCDEDHDYTPEQQAMDGGLMDGFVQYTGTRCEPRRTLDYYDGNTVTALWSYAQHFALSDDSFGTTFGPSTPGALNLVSGQTHGALEADRSDEIANGTIIGDPDPLYDDCSDASDTAALSGRNVGDLLNAAGVTWGWFEGGFAPTGHKHGLVVCHAEHENVGGTEVFDYSPHHEPFQYYASTSNPHHLPPTSVAMIGHSDQANHQYDLSDFWAAADAGNLPAVSFLKAAKYQDGHPGYSDPLDEQTWLVTTINRLEQLPSWRSTAVIIAWDDSDGWYDHVAPTIVNPSDDPGADAYTAPGVCGGTPAAGAYLDRCGYGPRLPLLVVSPFARRNFVDHTLTDQTSVLRLIEDNWRLGRIGDQSFDALAGSLGNMFDFSAPPAPRLFLDPSSGEPVPRPT